MKIIKYRNYKKSIIATVVAVLVLVSLVTAGYFYQRNKSEQADKLEMNAPTEQEIQAGKDIKQSTIDQSSDNKSQTGSDPSPAPLPIEGSDKMLVGSKTTVTVPNDGLLRIRTLLQTVTNSGTCDLMMNGPNGATYSSSVDVQALPSSSTCKGFDVPTEELATGKWTIKVTFNNDQLTAVSQEEVTVP